MTQLHKIWSSVVLMSVVIAAFVIFYNAGIDKYSLTDFNETQLTTLQQQGDNMSAVADDIRQSINKINQSASAFDVIGGFFSSGYHIMRGALVGFDSVYTVTTVGVESVSKTSGAFTDILMMALITLLVFAVFLGIGMAIIMKSDKL